MKDKKMKENLETVPSKGMKGTRNVNSIKFRSIAALLGAAMMLSSVSCKKDSGGNVSPAIPENGFRAATEGHAGDSKTHLEGYSVMWNNGDKILVTNSEGTAAVFTQNGVNYGTTSDFTTSTEGFSFTGPFHAVYPESFTYSDANGFVGTGNVNGTQEYVQGGFANGANIMAAYSNSQTLQFHNLCGVIKFTLMGSGTVSKITLKSKNNADVLWGKPTVKFDANNNPSLSFTNSSSTKNQVSMTCNLELSSVTGQDVYFVLPAGTLSKGFTLTVDGVSDLNQDTNSGNTIKVSTLTVMPTITNAAIDLSSYVSNTDHKCANCYIVQKEGNYKFYCGIKGNGVVSGNAVLNSSTNTETPSIGTVTGAEVVWETVNTATVPEQGSVVNGVKLSGDAKYVEFHATGIKGNAVIAVKNGSNVLWSWHIWVTDRPAEKVINGVTFMDRCIGALATGGDYAVGLLYQWGRKDPFVGVAGLMNENDVIKTYPNFDVYNTALNAVDNGVTMVSNTIKNPDKFYKRNETSVDWFCNTPSASNGLWGGDNGKHKTMYDPCPSGWMVPDNSVWDEWTTENFVWVGNGRTYTSAAMFWPSFRTRTSSAVLEVLADYKGYGQYWTTTPGANGVYGINILISRVNNFDATSLGSRGNARPIFAVSEEE